MAFDGEAANQQIDASLSAVALLNSSCQAVIEAEVADVSSPWYAQLDEELGTAENLVVAWRQSGFLDFKSQILQAIDDAGGAFQGHRAAIDDLFDSIERNYSAAEKAKLAGLIQDLEPPVAQVASEIDAYLAGLKKLESDMGAADQEMRGTIGRVQSQEQQIQAQIDNIDGQIRLLGDQVKADRKAIAEARSARTTGIIETVFGVVFAPVTGGASLILAGIGAASISGAQQKIDDLESTISGFQRSIAADQAGLERDQAIVATLNSLVLSTGLVLDDLADIAAALDGLRTTWTMFEGEIANVAASMEKATSAADVVVGQVWFDAAVIEWQKVMQHVGDLLGADITTTRVEIG